MRSSRKANAVHACCTVSGIGRLCISRTEGIWCVRGWLFVEARKLIRMNLQIRRRKGSEHSRQRPPIQQEYKRARSARVEQNCIPPVMSFHVKLPTPSTALCCQSQSLACSSLLFLLNAMKPDIIDVRVNIEMRGIYTSSRFAVALSCHDCGAVSVCYLL